MAAIYQWFNLGEFVITSPMYPIEFEDAQINSTSVGHGRLVGAWAQDAQISDTIAVYGTNPYLMTFGNGEDDAQINDTTPGHGDFGGGIVIYPEGLDAQENATAVGSGTLEGKLITYYNHEDAQINLTAVGYGTLV